MRVCKRIPVPLVAHIARGAQDDACSFRKQQDTMQRRGSICVVLYSKCADGAPTVERSRGGPSRYEKGSMQTGTGILLPQQRACFVVESQEDTNTTGTTSNLLRFPDAMEINRLPAAWFFATTVKHVN